MPRSAKLGQKNGHWYSEAGGSPRYYGKVGVVSYDDALKSFREQLLAPRAPAPAKITVEELVEKFLTWLAENRSGETVKHHRYHLKRWCAAFGKRPATSIRAEHLETFEKRLAGQGFAPIYVKKHASSVRFLFRRAVKRGWLPTGFAPFDTVEQRKTPMKPLSESCLLTKDEYARLLEWADADLTDGRPGSWHGFGDMLRVYYATGARTSELAAAKVADFQPRLRQLILGNHKRSNTLKRDETRQITLNDEAYTIVDRLCKGRASDAPIFTQPRHERQRDPVDKPWVRYALSTRLIAVRRLAGVRPDVTIYSFRHLWISEMLMAGVDVMLVARMAGTSVAMIEKVYGHFRSQSFQDAQAKLDVARGKISDP